MSRYLTFISYRHKERDRRIAGLLRRGLENWYLPKDAPFDRKNRRCFRDTDELPTSADLGADIENALNESRWLITICSEDYVQSKWCLREIEMFIALGRKDRILPVLIGEKTEDCVPDIIKDIPIVAKIEKKDRNADKAIAALFARMAEESISKADETFGKEKKNNAGYYLRAEKNRRMLRYAAIAAAVITAVLGIAVYANLSANRIAENNERIKEATEETLKAEQEAKEERDHAILMNARKLSVEGWEALNEGDSDKAIELALSALPDDLHGDEPVSDEAVSVLRAALSNPNNPVDEWQYTTSFKTDFEIKDYMANYNLTAGLLLLDGKNSLEEHILNYSNNQIETVQGASRTEASELGYSMGYYCLSGAPQYCVYYGPEKKLVSYQKSVKVCDGFLLDGEYIYADHVLEGKASYYMLTWLEKSEEGKESPPCLIHLRNQEAIGKIEITGNPVSASFSNNYSRLAVVDEAGVLAFFDVNTAVKKAELPGKWKTVYYAISDNQCVCIDVNGKAYVYDTDSLDKIFEFESPAPVKSIQFCSEKSIYLALCEDAVRIYNEDDGKLLNEISFQTETAGETPKFAVFEKYDDYLWGHNGNAFYLIYDNRVDKYTIETKTDLSKSDYIPLYEEGLFSSCSKAFYSRDGKYIYRQEYHGELSKWDAKTGEFIWANKEAWTVQGNVHENAIESRDGNYIWRANSDMDGLEKVDAATGKTLYSAAWGSQTDRRHVLMPTETNGKVAVSKCQFDNHLIGFDKDTGKLLWFKKDVASVFCFSEDEETIYAFCEEDGETERKLLRKELRVSDGKVLKEEILYSVPLDVAGTFWIYMDKENRKAVFLTDVTKWKTPEKTGRDKTYYLYLYDAATGSQIDHWEAEHADSFIFSYTGKMALQWTSMEDEDEYCMELLPNGETGAVIQAETEDGRKLTTKKTDQVMDNRPSYGSRPEREYALFAGDEVCIRSESSLDTVVIKRITDGALIFEVTDWITLSPDGGSCCIYGWNTNPRIILASDADTLVKKARKRQEEKTGESSK